MDRAHAAHGNCNFCMRPGHQAPDSWINPKTPNNRLDALKAAGSCNEKKPVGNSGGREPRRQYPPKNHGSAPASMAHGSSEADRRAYVLLLDSGTTSYMRKLADRVLKKETSGIEIFLADNENVEATAISTRRVKWKGSNGPTVVALSDTLVAPDLAARFGFRPGVYEERK